MAVVTGTFTGVSASPALVPVPGEIFNLHVSGDFDAVVFLERSFDGEDWLPFVESKYTFLLPNTVQVDEGILERETGVQYRLNCVSITRGSVSYRISQ